MIDFSFYHKLEDNGWGNIYHRKSSVDISECLNGITSDLPAVDQVETTNLCNLKCKMCPRPKKMTRPLIRSMRREVFERIIDQIEEIEQEKINRGLTKKSFIESPPRSLIWPGSLFDITSLRLHHFGSPLLDTLLLERLEYITGNTSFDAQLSETVINLTVEKAQELFRRKLGRLIIALDATNGEEFKRIRGRSVDFPKEVQKIKDIAAMKVAEGYQTALNVQVIKLAEANDEFAKFWKNVDGVEILHKPFFPYPDIDHDNGTSEDDVFKGGCFFPFTSITILADGRAVPCNSDYNGEMILGDTNVQSLSSIWTGETMKLFRENFVQNTFAKDHLCSRCGYYPFRSTDGNT
jgi:radical SAM protein with 4Fe4S-binding SPASM domain